MLAYVFWHWKRKDASAAQYEARQREFHAALADAPPAGFAGSFSVALHDVPWVPGTHDAYEDWYLLQDFAALGTLNEAAVSGSRAPAHDRAAADALGGAGGLYRLRHGGLLHQPGQALWFSKPEGMRYGELFDRVTPALEEGGGALWIRQLTLGPAREFCLHTEGAGTLPAPFTPLALRLRTVWPDSPARL